MSNTKIGAYQQHVKTTETVQETEAAVLEKAAFILENAQRSPTDDLIFQEALGFNQQVWGAIQSVLNDESQLPKEIVANLMSLSIFADRQLAKAQIEEDRNLLTSVININRNIAAGLRDAARLAAKQSSNDTSDAAAPPPVDRLPPTEA